MTICHDEIAGGYGKLQTSNVELIPSTPEVSACSGSCCIISLHGLRIFQAQVSDVIVLRRSAVNLVFAPADDLIKRSSNPAVGRYHGTGRCRERLSGSLLVHL